MGLKLVGIDMDATLLRDDKSYDEERFNAVYEKLQEMGVQVTIASGNGLLKLEEYLSHMDRESIYFASDNGTNLVKGGEVLRRSVIDEQEMAPLINFLRDEGGFDLFVSDGDNFYTFGVNPLHVEFLSQYYSGPLHELRDTGDLAGMDVIKVSCYSSRSLEETKDVMNKIVRKFPNLEAVTSGYGWLDVYDLSGGKGEAIAYIQDKYGIGPDETMVFGDSLNDASMFLRSNYAVAMANGDQALKEMADFIIGTHEEQAVLDVLEGFAETGNLDFMEQYRHERV